MDSAPAYEKCPFCKQICISFYVWNNEYLRCLMKLHETQIKPQMSFPPNFIDSEADPALNGGLSSCHVDPNPGSDRVRIWFRGASVRIFGLWIELSSSLIPIEIRI